MGLENTFCNQESGIEECSQNWYVAVVNNNSEKKVAQALNQLGYEVYVPTQMEERVVRGKLRSVEKVLLPAMVFVHCTDAVRLEIVNIPFVKRFRVDIAKKNVQGGHSLMVIPDCQMVSFRLALDYKRKEQVFLEESPLVLGDEVEVKKGELMGMRGNIINLPDGNKQVVVSLGSLASIRLSIPASYLRKRKTT